MTQITVEMPDPLGPYFVRFGPHPFRPAWRRVARTIVWAGVGALVGAVSARGWNGDLPPIFGVGSFVFLTCFFYGNLAMRMSHDIARTRMYHAIAVAYLEAAKIEDLLRPREELGAQTL